MVLGIVAEAIAPSLAPVSVVVASPAVAFAAFASVSPTVAVKLSRAGRLGNGNIVVSVLEGLHNAWGVKSHTLCIVI